MLVHGDCVAVMATMPPASVSAIVCDPPYGLVFMGRGWDDLGHGNAQQAWHARWLTEALRILKPGGHLLAFGGTRTYHRLACAAEDVGFEIRDSLHWHYGSGMAKGLNVGKAVDAKLVHGRTKVTRDQPQTPEGAQWDGWATGLAPAHEPILLARKPPAGNVAANVLAHGTGALNIDACRTGTVGGSTQPSGMDRYNAANATHGYRPSADQKGTPPLPLPKGRWPKNVLFTHAPGCAAECVEGCPVAGLDAQSGVRKSGAHKRSHVRNVPRLGAGGVYGEEKKADKAFTRARPASSGGASRFFPVTSWDPVYDLPFLYTAKTAKKEREAGCEKLAERHGRKRGNNHATVKPVAVMRWCLRLVTPPGGVVLDPFAGSGTTLVAARLEGIECIGVEQEAGHCEIAAAREAHAGPLR